MKKFFSDKVKNILKVLGIIVALLVVFDVRVSWQRSMPDDSDAVCSLKTGNGYVVSNGFSGVFLHRRASLDAECARRLK